jgi:hypothetical protein
LVGDLGQQQNKSENSGKNSDLLHVLKGPLQPTPLSAFTMVVGETVRRRVNLARSLQSM